MKRIAIEGSWFDADSATRWDEHRNWDGSNYISAATGSQWNHEALYRTRGGKWITLSWSDIQGRGETYCRVDDRDAVAWLIANEHDIPDDLQDCVNSLEL